MILPAKHCIIDIIRHHQSRTIGAALLFQYRKWPSLIDESFLMEEQKKNFNTLIEERVNRIK